MFHLLLLVTVLSTCMADEEPQDSASAAPIRVYDDYQRENLRLRQNLARLRHDLNIRGNPHSHLDDPYRRNMGQRHNYREEHDARPAHGNHREDIGHDAWRSHHERQWWSDMDRIEHVDDNHDIQGPVILRTIKPHEDGHKPDIARQNKIIADVFSPDYAQPTWIVDYRYLKTGGRDYTRGPGGQILILPKGIHTNEHKEFKNYDELIEHLRERHLAERQKPQYFMPLGQEINEHEKNNKRDYEWQN